MSFQIKLDPCPIPGKGPGFYLQGPYVTDSVHSKIAAVMADNRIDSKNYKARTAVSAFFQGGYDDPEGEFVFIEILPDRPSDAIEQFENILNAAVYDVIPLSLTDIKIAVNTTGAVYFASEIAEEVGCEISLGNWGEPITLYPKDTVQWLKAMKMARDLGLNIIERRSK